MAQRVHSARRIRAQILDSFRLIVSETIQSYIADRINETLEVNEHDHQSHEQNATESKDSNDIITTQQETDVQLVLQHIGGCGSKGAAIGELVQVMPGKRRPQIQRMLNRLQANGRIHMKGKARGARWHLVNDDRS